MPIRSRAARRARAVAPLSELAVSAFTLSLPEMAGVVPAILLAMSEVVFSPGDLAALTEIVAGAWRLGADRDWSVPAGTLEWSCTQTADHAVDTLLAPAFNLASRLEDRGVGMHWGIFTMGPDATPQRLVEGLETASRILCSVVIAAEPGARACIRSRPTPQSAPAADFVPRGGVELILHAHDVCAGLRVRFEPPPDLVARLREHLRSWQSWWPAWGRLTSRDDAWGDLLEVSGRSRYASA
jgi:hypothetical protein